jgi:hypothetical protein
LERGEVREEEGHFCEFWLLFVDGTEVYCLSPVLYLFCGDGEEGRAEGIGVFAASLVLLGKIEGGEGGFFLIWFTVATSFV